MNTRQKAKHLVTLVAACAIILVSGLGLSKPPVTDPDPGLTYTTVVAGGLGYEVGPEAINEAGTVVGTIYSDYPHTGYAFYLEPDNGAYYRDDDSDGLNDLVQLLPQVADDAYALDINNAGQIAGYELLSSGAYEAVVWDGGVRKLAVPGTTDARALAINDDGVVAGVIEPDWDAGGWAYTAFIIVPVDQDADGTPDTWFADSNSDGVNDLMYVVGTAADPEWEDGYQAVGVLGDLSVVMNGGAYERGAWLVEPDFSDPDGDGNPWYADVDADGVNDLQAAFVTSGLAGSTTPSGLIAGATEGEAVLFDAVTMGTTLLGGTPDRGSSAAVAVNDAGWTVGTLVDRKGASSSVLWMDGSVNAFEDIMSGEAAGVMWPADINQAGVIVGVSIDDGLVIAFPSGALPPEAVDDEYAVTVGNTLTVASPGVLANDGDIVIDALSAAIATLPTKGALSYFDEDGAFEYVPVESFEGTDSFTYRLSSGGELVGIATVAITVMGASAAPGSISGTVYDATGKPVRKDLVVLKDGNENTWETTTNPQGKYSFNEIPAGTGYMLTAYNGGASCTVTSIEVTAGATETIDVYVP